MPLNQRKVSNLGSTEAVEVQIETSPHLLLVGARKRIQMETTQHVEIFRSYKLTNLQPGSLPKPCSPISWTCPPAWILNTHWQHNMLSSAGWKVGLGFDSGPMCSNWTKKNVRTQDQVQQGCRIQYQYTKINYIYRN